MQWLWHNNARIGWMAAGLFWLSVLAAGVADAQTEPTGKPLVQSYSIADIGTDAMSWVTVQGSDGVLHFGCDTLVSFDGLHWTHTSANGASALRGLDFGKKGQLWAAATNEIGWFAPKATGGWTYQSLVSELPAEHRSFGESWHAFADGEGAVFVTAEKILRWRDSKFEVYPFPGGRHLEAMRVGEDIYVHHSPTGLYLMEASGPRLIIPAAVLGKSMVFWIEKQPHGFLIATGKGLFSYDGEQLTPFSEKASNYVSKNILTCALRLWDGRLALGTYEGGIALVAADGTLEGILGENDGLPTRSIYSLFADRERGLWVTSDSNIFRLGLHVDSTYFTRATKVEDQPIVSVVRNQGKLTVATANALWEVDPVTGRFQAMETSASGFAHLQPIPDGLLVAGSGGIKKIHEAKTTSFLYTPKTAYLVSPSRVHSGYWLVSETQSLILLGPDGSSRELVKNLPDVVTSVAEDAQGRLWMGTSTHGVMVAKLDKLLPVDSTPAGPAFGIPDLKESGRLAATADGTVVAFTASGGWILRPAADRFIAIDKFPQWSVNATSEFSPDGKIWVVHPATDHRADSIAQITVGPDRAVWEPHSVDGLWNVGTPECILAEPAATGETTLWIGGTTGLLRSVVAHGPVAPAPKAPFLRTLARLGEDPNLQPANQPLPYSTRSVVFEFSTTEFTRRRALRLESMLDGVDQHWVPADASSRRELTALRDGRYTFRVRVVAETGATSPATVSVFEITPPWWRTSTALLAGLLALVPTAYAAYRWRVQLLRRRNAELEQKVLERTDQLEKASAAKTQFVANMSHDIRNPLNGIVGLALALEDTWLDAKQRELVSTLRECTTYLSTLVDDVLDFASIEAGRVELRPGPFSPAELLRSITIMFKMEAIASGAVLQVEADPRLPAAYVGDAGRIQQILVNFVTNALKYAGGPIKLSVRIPVDAPEEIEFSVSDRGPGISPDGQRQLFNKFSRLTGSQSKEITGTGLGLASCRLLAGLMSGSVGVYSEVGHGARFHLRLPLEIFPVPAPNAPVPAPMASPVLPNCTVLLVEDTNYNAMAATAVLAKFGLGCERATSGAEALKLFSAKRHNLVLLDRNLPDMDGVEIARSIRAMEANGPRTIMLAVTAYCTLEDRALCLNAGMDAFVGKPLTPQKLRRVLTAAGRRHLAAASMHVSPEVAATGVDISLLEYISDGTDQGLSRQIELFLTALGEAERQLHQAEQTNDFKLLGDAAHGVLSHARLVGSAALSTAAAGLQNAANSRDRDAFGSLLVRVRREIDSLTAVVRRHPGAERPR